MMHPMQDAGDQRFWVFGYGSLMWRPGFAHSATQPAVLTGYHRALCVYSHVHRGTPERPGLVFGLDRGGACRGMAFAVEPEDREAVIAYLRAREQVTAVYLERWFRIRLGDGRRVTALTYVVDRAHRQYAGRLAHDELLSVVRGAEGQSGRNPDYVTATQAALEALGVHDRTVAQLARELMPPA
jgi:glutathione-specific gamma-glutamylcyclotransferase